MGIQFNLIGFADYEGTWRVESILIAMCIYSFFLLVMTLLWLYRYYGSKDRKVKKLRLILLYVFSQPLINAIGQLIENTIFKLDGFYTGLHLTWGETKDIWITVLAPVLFPILVSLLLLPFIKRYYAKKYAEIDVGS